MAKSTASTCRRAVILVLAMTGLSAQCSSQGGVLTPRPWHGPEAAGADGILVSAEPVAEVLARAYESVSDLLMLVLARETCTALGSVRFDEEQTLESDWTKWARALRDAARLVLAAEARARSVENGDDTMLSALRAFRQAAMIPQPERRDRKRMSMLDEGEAGKRLCGVLSLVWGGDTSRSAVEEGSAFPVAPDPLLEPGRPDGEGCEDEWAAVRHLTCAVAFAGPEDAQRSLHSMSEVVLRGLGPIGRASIRGGLWRLVSEMSSREALTSQAESLSHLGVNAQQPSLAGYRCDATLAVCCRLRYVASKALIGRLPGRVARRQYVAIAMTDGGVRCIRGIARQLQEAIEELSGTTSRVALVQEDGLWDWRAMDDVRNAGQLVDSLLRLWEKGCRWILVDRDDAAAGDIETLRGFLLPTRPARRVALVNTPSTQSPTSWINYEWPLAGDLVQHVAGVSAAAPSPKRAVLAFPTVGLMSPEGRWTVPK